jgi:FlaA1/EpsC-like NDP-sugar epimerase
MVGAPPVSAGRTIILSDTEIHTVIADIRFRERVYRVFEEYQPEVVLHSAAHKHVPLMEMNPSEAITNNVLGTQILLDAAQMVGVEHFVMISTDKAVNPKGIMGASKRVAELLVHQAAVQSRGVYVAVRFGNVLGSRGSVVETFKQQIAVGGPLTVTHPDMTRYFMTIPEAVQLVLQAATLGEGGEVFMLDMGERVKIVDLARDLIELSGLTVGRDIDIVFTGIRPGEKLAEELHLASEEYEPTEHDKILSVRQAPDVFLPRLDRAVTTLIMAAQADDRRRINSSLQLLVPEFEQVGRRAQKQTQTNVINGLNLGMPEPLRPSPSADGSVPFGPTAEPWEAPDGTT